MTAFSHALAAVSLASPAGFLPAAVVAVVVVSFAVALALVSVRRRDLDRSGEHREHAR